MACTCESQSSLQTARYACPRPYAHSLVYKSQLSSDAYTDVTPVPFALDCLRHISPMSVAPELDFSESELEQAGLLTDSYFGRSSSLEGDQQLDVQEQRHASSGGTITSGVDKKKVNREYQLKHREREKVCHSFDIGCLVVSAAPATKAQIAPHTRISVGVHPCVCCTRQNNICAGTEESDAATVGRDNRRAAKTESEADPAATGVTGRSSQ